MCIYVCVIEYMCIVFGVEQKEKRKENKGKKIKKEIKNKFERNKKVDHPTKSTLLLL